MTDTPTRLRDLIERFRDIPPATIGHYVNEGFVDTAIRPIFKHVKAIGPAFTLRMVPGDSTLTRPALERVAPGDVLVIDQGGDTRAACWGEMTSLRAKTAGVTGVIIDGAVTDVVEIEQQGLPTWARAISALTGRRLERGGGIQVPVQCGGVLVNPGDLVVADDNGICVLTLDAAEAVYAQARDAEDRAPFQRIWLQNGGSLTDMGGKTARDLEQMVRARGWG